MKIEQARQQYEDQLMALPNVNGVGIGEKAGEPVIQVFVTRKLPKSALKPHEIVPGKVEGFETDVEEIGIVTAQTG